MHNDQVAEFLYISSSRYYVDNHELPMNVAYRADFIDRYFSYEFRCHRWIVISESYGGHLSVRMPPNTKPLMILGQDECIFKQYLFTKGVWVMPDGTRQLIPKEEGHGIMISSLCSRELFPVCKRIVLWCWP